MDNIIRKVIIGKDIIKDSMNYTVGQTIGSMKITDILLEDDGTILIYVESNGEKFKWKRLSNSVAATVEYSTSF